MSDEIYQVELHPMLTKLDDTLGILDGRMGLSIDRSNLSVLNNIVYIWIKADEIPKVLEITYSVVYKLEVRRALQKGIV